MDTTALKKIIQNHRFPSRYGLQRRILLMSPNLKAETFDVNEFKVAQNSPYYRHIPFEKIL
jgi:hypothetical protein